MNQLKILKGMEVGESKGKGRLSSGSVSYFICSSVCPSM